MDRQELEERYGQLWTTNELQEDFIVHSFSAPFVSVTRKEDNSQGTLKFQHSPRFYFEFVPRHRVLFNPIIVKKIDR